MAGVCCRGCGAGRVLGSYADVTKHRQRSNPDRWPAARATGYGLLDPPKHRCRNQDNLNVGRHHHGDVTEVCPHLDVEPIGWDDRIAQIYLSVAANGSRTQPVRHRAMGS